MASIAQVRGALLEEVVLFLLSKVGYQTIDPAALAAKPVPGLRSGHSGLEAQGRGTWHQLDALSDWIHSPPFMYPLRLIVEAKCYKNTHPIQLSTVRNAVGVLKDVTENYFSFQPNGGGIKGQRYNYAAAIFSPSGFTRGAVEYAVAHQVFLIQYDDVAVIAPVIDAIYSLEQPHVSLEKGFVQSARKALRAALNDQDSSFGAPMTSIAAGYIYNEIGEKAKSIGGSYFGMLQGRWPMHLLRDEPLPAIAFETDTVACVVRRGEHGGWHFEPIQFARGQPGWFKLEFSLPEAIAELVSQNPDDRVALANVKQQHFSFIDLTGTIGGIRRSVRLQLDADWIDSYVDRQRSLRHGGR